MLLTAIRRVPGIRHRKIEAVSATSSDSTAGGVKSCSESGRLFGGLDRSDSAGEGQVREFGDGLKKLACCAAVARLTKGSRKLGAGGNYISACAAELQ